MLAVSYLRPWSCICGSISVVHIRRRPACPENARAQGGNQFAVGFANEGRRDARPTFRFMESAELDSVPRWWAARFGMDSRFPIVDNRLVCSRAKILGHAKYPSPSLRAPSPLGGERDRVRGAFGCGIQHVPKLLRNHIRVVKRTRPGASPVFF